MNLAINHTVNVNVADTNTNTNTNTNTTEPAVLAVPANDLVATAPTNDVVAVATRRPAGTYFYARWRVDVMLAAAGYDAALIPVGLRKDALWVAWCFAKNLFDVADIAAACSASRRNVRACIVALRGAARPGTKVG